MSKRKRRLVRFLIFNYLEKEAPKSKGVRSSELKLLNIMIPEEKKATARKHKNSTEVNLS